jgi:hypothetical protein
MAFDQLAIDTTFRAFGKAATYTPPGGGTPVACSIVLDKRDPDQRPDEGRPLAGVLVLEVRASEVAAPAARGTFLVGAKTYTVANRPERSDPEGLAWTMWVE